MSLNKLLFLFVLLILVLAGRFYQFYRTMPQYNDGQQVTVKASLTQEPKIVTGRQQFSVRTPDGLRISVTASMSPLLHYGDSVVIDGELKKKTVEDKEFWSLYFPKVQLVNSEQNIVSAAAFAVRSKAKQLANEALPPTSANLLLGIVFGGNQGLDDDFSKKLRTVGVLHVVAASGMNVSFVAAALLFILGNLVKRQFALFIAGLGIVFYVFLAGFEPSIIRAAIMSILSFTAALVGRQNAALTTLGITAYLMVFITPSLVNDIGFQLSFLSTLGILLIQPLLPLGTFLFLSEDIGTTTAAQIATLPIMFADFGQYGLLSILVNGLVLWMIPLLMIIGSVAVITGLVFAPLGVCLLYLTFPFLWFFEMVVNFFGGQNWIVEVKEFPMLWVVGYYCLLGAILVWLRKRKALGIEGEVKETILAKRKAKVEVAAISE